MLALLGLATRQVSNTGRAEGAGGHRIHVSDRAGMDYAMLRNRVSLDLAHGVSEGRRCAQKCRPRRGRRLSSGAGAASATWGVRTLLTASWQRQLASARPAR
jgi:hypothetical protein